MASVHTHFEADQSRPSRRIARAALGFTWHIIRVPVLTLLVILEPFVRTVLAGVAILGVLMAFFWEFVVRPPHFPFWLTLGLSIGSALLLVPWYALMNLLSRRSLTGH